MIAEKKSRKTNASSSEQLQKTIQITSCQWLRSEKMQTQMRMFGQHDCMRVIPLYLHQHEPQFATLFTCVMWRISNDIVKNKNIWFAWLDHFKRPFHSRMKTFKRDWWCQWKKESCLKGQSKLHFKKINTLTCTKKKSCTIRPKHALRKEKVLVVFCYCASNNISTPGGDRFIQKSESVRHHFYYIRELSGFTH